MKRLLHWADCSVCPSPLALYPPLSLHKISLTPQLHSSSHNPEMETIAELFRWHAVSIGCVPGTVHRTHLHHRVFFKCQRGNLPEVLISVVTNSVALTNPAQEEMGRSHQMSSLGVIPLSLGDVQGVHKGQKNRPQAIHTRPTFNGD